MRHAKKSTKKVKRRLCNLFKKCRYGGSQATTFCLTLGEDSQTSTLCEHAQKKNPFVNFFASRFSNQKGTKSALNYTKYSKNSISIDTRAGIAILRSDCTHVARALSSTNELGFLRIRDFYKICPQSRKKRGLQALTC